MTVLCRRCIAIFFLSAAWALAAGAWSAEEDRPPDYNQQIAPLFNKYCNACHNADDKEGGLVLEDYAALLKGGKRGGVIAAGSPERSRLLLVLEGKAEPKMPPKDSEPPKPEEIALLRAWIAAGARGPHGAALDPAELVIPRIEPTVKPRQPITALAWSPDGAYLAIGGPDGALLRRLDRHAAELRFSGQRGQVNSLAFLPDGRLVGAAGQPGLFGEAAIWHSAAMEPGPPKIIRGHRDSLLAAIPSPDGKLLATASYDEKIKLWDLESSAERLTISGHNGPVFDLAFGRGGKLLATASGDRTVKLWDVASGQRLDTFGQPFKELYTVAFSPSGDRVAAGGVDNRLRVWEISESAKEGTNPLLVSRFAHQSAILKIVWSPDGKQLASSAEDGTLKIWNASTIQEQFVLPTQPDWPVALAFSPDSTRLAVGRLDGTLALYDTKTGKEVK